jgi:hypothetical protein
MKLPGLGRYNVLQSLNEGLMPWRPFIVVLRSPVAALIRIHWQALSLVS